MVMSRGFSRSMGGSTANWAARWPGMLGVALTRWGVWPRLKGGIWITTSTVSIQKMAVICTALALGAPPPAGPTRKAMLSVPPPTGMGGDWVLMMRTVV